MSVKETIEKSDEEFVEAGAALEHERWARWQEYMFSKFEYREEKQGEKTIAFYILPADSWEHWNREIDTDYADLPEAQKESDRKETREYLHLLHSRDKALLEAYKEELRGEMVGQIKHFQKLHDESMPMNTLIAYHADSSIRAFRTVLAIINNQPLV